MAGIAIEGELVKRHPGGRPPKLTPSERAEVYEAFRLYIERTPDPTVAGFLSWDKQAIEYNVTRDNINDWQEFSTLLQRAVRKQEAFLLEAGGSGRYNTALAIFRLKQPQHGYRDRVETDLTSGGDKVQPVLVKFITSGEDVGNTDTV